MGVKGYPSIKYVSSGDFVLSFRGTRSLDSFEKFAARVSSDAVAELETEGDLDQAMQRHETFFLLVSGNHVVLEEYENASRTLLLESVYFSAKPSSLPKMGTSQSSSLYVHQVLCLPSSGSCF
jgi:hypothetical protein